MVGGQTSFTTKPKIRRRVRHSISGSRARDFMEHLWRKGLKKCSYPTLKFEFILFFETNDRRVYERHIGCPREIVRYAGATVVRQNRTSGKSTQFMYSNQRTKKAKLGLMEVLGYITLDKNTAKVTFTMKLSHTSRNKQPCKIHPLRNPPLQECNGSSIGEVSKDDLWVS